jgi:crotonobetainyl-CoA:carnitine CoA-transferase CaiB-like acyl-CoA transferase
MTNQQRLNAFIREQRKGETKQGFPLRDIRVLDMATVMAAPFAATLLGDLGAEVIKLENPDLPDAIRGWGVLDCGVHPFWAVYGRNKFPITINLKSDGGKKIFTQLIEKSDVLVENMRPGAMEKLGLDPETLLKHNPGLVIGKVSGYGQNGPYASKPGFGTLAEGFSGFTYLNAQPGGVPTNPPLALGDFVAGLHLAFAIMTCLRGSTRGVRGGQVIDISLYEPLFGLFGADFLAHWITGEIPQPQGNELSYVVPRNNYRTRDGKWVALSASAQKACERLMEAIGRPEMNEDPRFKTNPERIKDENRGEINRVVADWISSKDLEEVLGRGDELGITIGPIATMEDIAKDAHYKARGSWIELVDPVTGEPLAIPNLPFRIVGSAARIRFPGLPHGSCNDVILEDLLGYSMEEIAQLRKSSAI